MKSNIILKQVAVFSAVMFLLSVAPVLAEDAPAGPPPDIPAGPSLTPQIPQMPQIPQGPSPEEIQKMEQQGQKQQKKGEEQQKKGQEQQLKGMKQGVKSMAKELTKLENAYNKAQTKGATIPQEVKDKLAKGKEMVDKINAAQSAEELGDIDLNDLGEIIQSLNESKDEIINAPQRMAQIKKGMKGAGQGLSSFEKQLAKLTKQNIAIPEEIKTNLQKAKDIIAAITNAKTWQEMQDAGLDDVSDAMSTLNEYRNQLEMLARWPQTLKQMDQQLKMLNSQLAKNKTLVEKLKKQGIDLSDNLAEFAAAIQTLKAVRNKAVETVKGSDPQSAFDSAEADFFDRIDEVMENSRVIQTMANLSRFAKDFKSGVAQAQAQIKKMKAKKINTAEPEAILKESIDKGNKILNLIKAKPLDEEAISAGIEAMENLRQEFYDKVAELTGEDAAMPWEQGPNQFQAPKMQFNLNQYTKVK